MGSKFYPLRATIGESNGTPLQYSCLENPMDGGAWWAAVHGVAKSRAWLSDFTFALHFHALEKEIATHSSVLAWRIPETEEPGGLPSMGSHRVGHDWSDLAAAAAAELLLLWGFPGGASSKRIHLPMQEMWEIKIWSLDWKHPLEKEMATHSSILAWKTSWTAEPGVHGIAKSQTWLSDWGHTLLIYSYVYYTICANSSNYKYIYILNPFIFTLKFSYSILWWFYCGKNTTWHLPS